MSVHDNKPSDCYLGCTYMCDVSIWLKAHLCPKGFCKFALVPRSTLLLAPCCLQQGQHLQR